jgi:hypothetical protein
VTSWSVAAESLFGRPADVVLGGPFDILFPGHLCDEVHGLLASVRKGDRIRHFETEVLVGRRPDQLR